MSYTQPKYINESNADLLQNMQNKIDQAVDTSKRTIAAEKYRNDVFNIRYILLFQTFQMRLCQKK